MRKLNSNNSGFTWLIPLTMAVVVMFALLIAGSYIIGTIGSNLTESIEANPLGYNATGFINWTSVNQNETLEQISGFSTSYGEVGDILKVVAIIAAVGMAILAVMGIASKREG